MRKATRKYTRLHNARIVLRMIYDADHISRADISRSTQLTRATVSSIVSELMKSGLVEEDGVGLPAGGKPPILLRLVDDGRHLICVDMANDEFHGAIVNLRGEIKYRLKQPVGGKTGTDALGCAFDLVDSLVNASDRSILGIGIGNAGVTDSQNGIILQAVNFGWINLPIKRLMEERYKLPIHISNDCYVAALAEYTFSQHKGIKNLVLVRLGQGIGSGIVINGKLFHGDGYAAGEIGHLVVNEKGDRCTCGNYGCLETVASDRAIIKRAMALSQSNPNSTIDQLLQSQGGRSAAELICQALESDDTSMQQAIEEAGRYLGVALAYVIAVLNVHKIVLIGNITCLGDRFIKAVRAGISGHALPTTIQKTDVTFSNLGQDIVILGASALLLKEELGLV
jgi:glucokinase-like ROK family protein